MLRQGPLNVVKAQTVFPELFFSFSSLSFSSLFFLFFFPKLDRTQVGCCTWGRTSGHILTAAFGQLRCMRRIVLSYKYTVQSLGGATW